MTEVEKSARRPVSARAVLGDAPAALPPEPEKSSRRLETGVLAGGSMVLFLAAVTALMVFDMYRRLQTAGKTYTVTETVPVPALPGLAPASVSADTAAYAAGSALQGVLLGDLPVDTRDGAPVNTAARTQFSAGRQTARLNGNAEAAASLAELNGLMLKYKDKPGIAELVAALKKQGVDITSGGIAPKDMMTAYSSPEFQKTLASVMKKPAAQATILTMLADPAVQALFKRSKAAAGGAKTSPLDMIGGGSRKGGGSAASQLGIVADPQFAGVAAPARAGASAALAKSAPGEKTSSAVKIE